MLPIEPPPKLEPMKPLPAANSGELEGLEGIDLEELLCGDLVGGSSSSPSQSSVSSSTYHPPTAPSHQYPSSGWSFAFVLAVGKRKLLKVERIYVALSLRL